MRALKIPASMIVETAIEVDPANLPNFPGYYVIPDPDWLGRADWIFKPFDPGNPAGGGTFEPPAASPPPPTAKVWPGAPGQPAHFLFFREFTLAEQAAFETLALTDGMAATLKTRLLGAPDIRANDPDLLLGRDYLLSLNNPGLPTAERWAVILGTV